MNELRKKECRYLIVLFAVIYEGGGCVAVGIRHGRQKICREKCSKTDPIWCRLSTDAYLIAFSLDKNDPSYIHARNFLQLSHVQHSLLLHSVLL